VTYEEIFGKVKRARQKFGEDNPLKLAEAMGIKVLRESMGKDDDAVKGFYLEYKRVQVITLNSDMPLMIQQIVCAHELGHAVLHRKKGLHAFHEAAMFDESSLLEKEANIFAAEYLLKDEEVLDLLNQDITFFGCAAKLMVPPELLDFKFRMLKWKGYKIIESPVSENTDFMKNMPIPDSYDYESC